MYDPEASNCKEGLPNSEITAWVFGRQTLRQSLGCKMFMRHRHMEKKGEEAGLGRIYPFTLQI